MQTNSAFHSYLSEILRDITGDGTQFTIPSDTVLFDKGDNYDPPSGVFTVTEKGVYLFNVHILSHIPSGSRVVVYDHWMKVVTKDCEPRFHMLAPSAHLTSTNTTGVSSGSFTFCLDEDDKVSMGVTIRNRDRIKNGMVFGINRDGIPTAFSGHLVTHSF